MLKVTAIKTTPKTKDEMAQAMLKAQGLDLAEDELDDAISDLIDELDEGDDALMPGDDDIDAQIGDINLDDFDLMMMTDLYFLKLVYWFKTILLLLMFL